MNCRNVREQIESGALDAAAWAHITACPSCGAEWEFHGRLSRAMAAMPPVVAPTDLAARVMDQVRRSAPRFVLRRWEIVALGSLCLLLAGLVPAVLARWELLPALAAWRAAIAEAGSVAWRMADGGWRMAQGGLPLGWLLAGVAFAIALYVLLSWRPTGAERRIEDARA